jgi:hypothetical protein
VAAGAVVAAAGVPQAASTRLTSTTRLNRGNNLRMIFFSFSQIFYLGKQITQTQIGVDTSNPFILHRMIFLLSICE